MFNKCVFLIIGDLTEYVVAVLQHGEADVSVANAVVGFWPPPAEDVPRLV